MNNDEKQEYFWDEMTINLPKIKLFVVVRKGIADEPDTVWGVFSNREEAEKLAKKRLTYYYIEKDIVRMDHDIIEKAYKECIIVK